jgi:hypothetical protein
MSLDALVPLHDFFGVDGQPFVWVHHDTEQARVRLEQKHADIIHSTNTQSTKSMCLFICLFVTERNLDSTVSTVTQLQTAGSTVLFPAAVTDVYPPQATAKQYRCPSQLDTKDTLQNVL